MSFGSSERSPSESDIQLALNTAFPSFPNTRQLSRDIAIRRQLTNDFSIVLGASGTQKVDVL